jgi:hypothetical protein
MALALPAFSVRRDGPPYMKAIISRAAETACLQGESYGWQ